MAVKHFKKYGGGCFCGDITPAAAPLTKDDRWTEDPGDAKASKRCRKERARAIRSVAMHATAGQPISPAVAERRNDAAFLAFSRKVREAAGVPAGGSR